MLINVKMSTICGISIYIYEHDKLRAQLRVKKVLILTLGPGCIGAVAHIHKYLFLHMNFTLGFLKICPTKHLKIMSTVN